MSQPHPPPPGPPPAPPTGPPPDWRPQPPAYEPPTYGSPTYGPPTYGPPLPEQPPRPRRRLLPLVVGVVGAVLVVVAALALPRALREEARVDPTATGTRTGVGIEGLQVYPDLVADHTLEDVDYPQTPPVGGPHDPTWLACGAYDEPVRDENAVHDLEHGTVWVAYDPDLRAGDVDTLEGALPDNGIMAPYPGLVSPVVLTVWGRQLSLDGVDDPRLDTFLEQFGAGEAALEPFVGCQGGTPDPQGRVGGDA